MTTPDIFTIFEGTSEIQRMLIGLHRARRPVTLTSEDTHNMYPDHRGGPIRRGDAVDRAEFEHRAKLRQSVLHFHQCLLHVLFKSSPAPFLMESFYQGICVAGAGAGIWIANVL